MARRICPIFRAEKRLSDSEHFLVSAVKSYQEPDHFIRNVQAAITNLRSVTWVLQSEKRRIPGFEEWYEQQRALMRSDEVMKWCVDRRNDIEKKGDIEPASKLRLTFCPNLLSEFSQEYDFPAEYSAYDAACKLIDSEGLAGVSGESLIRIQREWCHPALPGWELLNALTHCYSVVQRLLLEAHCLLPKDSIDDCTFCEDPPAYNILLPAELQFLVNISSIWFRLDRRELFTFNLEQGEISVAQAKALGEEFGSSWKEFSGEIPSLRKQCELLMDFGQHLYGKLRHITPIFYIVGDNLRTSQPS
jgi:hypothetical protein